MESLPKICFCLTADEVATIDAARERLGKQGVLRNRSEVIRSAINMLKGIDDAELRSASEETLRLRPGRSHKRGNR